MSLDPDQHWDDYQEVYSTVSSSIIDLSPAEELLHFGDNYSDLLRQSVDSESSTASDSSSVAHSAFFRDESNAHALLDESFLLSGFKKSLPMSALKSIDEIFDFKELHSNAGTYGAIEWIEPSRSPRRSPSGTSCSKSTGSLSTISLQRDESTLATSNYFSAMDTGQESSSRDTSRSLSLESLVLDDLNDITIMPNMSTPAARQSSPLFIPSDRRESLLGKRIIRKARRRMLKPTNATSVHLPADTRSFAIAQLVAQNIKDLRPDDVRLILDTCQMHQGCLSHVLLGQTVNSIVQHPAVNVTSCGVLNGPCRCGFIARFVQSVVDFLMDYTNSFRHFVLYKLFLGTLRHMYGMVQTLSKEVRRHRMKLNSIEFVL